MTDFFSFFVAGERWGDQEDAADVAADASKVAGGGIQRYSSLT